MRGENWVVVSHPSDKNKDVRWMGPSIRVFNPLGGPKVHGDTIQAGALENRAFTAGCQACPSGSTASRKRAGREACATSYFAAKGREASLLSAILVGRVRNHIKAFMAAVCWRRLLSIHELPEQATKFGNQPRSSVTSQGVAKQAWVYNQKGVAASNLFRPTPRLLSGSIC